MHFLNVPDWSEQQGSVQKHGGHGDQYALESTRCEAPQCSTGCWQARLLSFLPSERCGSCSISVSRVQQHRRSCKAQARTLPSYVLQAMQLHCQHCGVWPQLTGSKFTRFISRSAHAQMAFVAAHWLFKNRGTRLKQRVDGYELILKQQNESQRALAFNNTVKSMSETNKLVTLS